MEDTVEKLKQEQKDLQQKLFKAEGRIKMDKSRDKAKAARKARKKNRK